MRTSTLAATSGVVVAAAVAGGLANRSAASDPAQSIWFAQLKKPSYQPPRQVFPIVWPALYADIAVTSAATLDALNDSGEHEEARKYATALGINLILNASWTWLFFNRHKLGLSAAVAGALAVSSGDLARRSVAVKGGKGAPLALYPLWCSFATMLSTHIWLKNRR
jgi:benzodiazapine receptor